MWPFRLIRGLRPDHNPLRRRYDRIGAAIAAVLLAAFLAGAPASALVAGRSAYAAALYTEHAHGTVRHHVSAVMLGSAPESAGPDALPVPVQAHWTAPDGRTRTGMITVLGGTPAGTTEWVWTDMSGRLTGPPQPGTSPLAPAILTGVFAVLGLATLLLCAGAAAHFLLERRRLAAWEAEWAALRGKPSGPHGPPGGNRT